MIQITSAAGIDDTFPDYIFSTTRVRFVDSTYVRIDDVMYLRSSILKLKSNSQGIATAGSSSAQTLTDLPFDGNRPVKRAGLPLINPATSSVKAFLEKYFYPFVPATIAMVGGDLTFEYGTIQSINIAALLTTNDEKSIANRRIIETTNGNNIVLVGAANNFNVQLDISGREETLTANKARIYRSLADVGGNGNPSTIQSAFKSINFYMPTMSGTSANLLTSPTLYQSLSKAVYADTVKQMSVTFNGTDKYLYFATPFYASTPVIKDNNGFDVSSSFVREILMNVPTGQKNPTWTHNYYVWRTIVPTTVANKVFTVTFP
jgi:lipoprotein-anchoring transpeptidase ErfK/SrfK